MYNNALQEALQRLDNIQESASPEKKPLNEMTFDRFQELFKTKYPNGEVNPHGKVGGGATKTSVEIVFRPYGKSYSYRGSYENILNSLGIPTIYRWELDQKKKDLQRYIDLNGKEDEDPFEEEGHEGPYFYDYTEQIADLEKEIAKIEKEYNIID